MKIGVQKAKIEQKTVIKNLLELYQYDSTEFEHKDLNEHGLYGYKYLDHYWTEEGRFPFLVKVNDKIAGFALVRSILQSEKSKIYSFAEFFILKGYRNKGVGKEVAFTIFNSMPGIWKVGQVENNLPAQKFWRKIINEYTNGEYEEIREKDWAGPIQRFESK